MKNRKMSQKITIAFGTVIACFLVTVAAMFYGMSTISRSYVKFHDQSHQALMHTYEIRVNLQAALKNLGLAVISDTSEDSSKYGQLA